MLSENKNKVKCFIYDYNEKLKLYIKLKRYDFNKFVINNSQDIETHIDKCVHCFGNKIYGFKTYDNLIECEKNCYSCIVNNVLENYESFVKNCVLSFYSYNDNNNLNKLNDNYFIDDEMHVSKIDYFSSKIVKEFFMKINELYINIEEKEKEKKKDNKKKISYSIQYSYAHTNNFFDLLEFYEDKEYFHSIKSCTLKRNNIDNIKCKTNVNIADISELKKFNEKNKQVKFTSIKKLKDILHTANKRMKEIDDMLRGKKIYSFFTVIVIDIYDETNDVINTTMSYNKGCKKFYFINMFYDVKKEIYENDDMLKKTLFEMSNIIKCNYIDEKFKINISNYEIISKLMYELFYEIQKLHINIYWNFTHNEFNNNVGDLLVYFINSIDYKMNNCIINSISNLKEEISKNDKCKLLNDQEKKCILHENEKYEKIENLLFKNISLDEYTKSYIIRKAIQIIPDKSMDNLLLLNKTFQQHYILYEEKEKDINENICHLINEQNEIMKKYEENEKRLQDDMNKIIDEIHLVDDKNLELKKEIQKHEELHKKYIRHEENRNKEDLKKLHTHNSILDEQYEHFLSFRKGSFVDDIIWNKQESQKNLYLEQKKIAHNNNIRDNVIDIINKHDEQYIKNFNEAKKYAQNKFEQSNELKKRYNHVIDRKVELFDVLKNTTHKLNEKVNSLMNNFRNAKELKLIYPIDSSFDNLKNNYEKDNLIINNLKGYTDLLEEFMKQDFNDKQLHWINKMNSLSKKF
ncbi:conserved Plasmodium protein, unknown function [Plasmodium sp. gorilla clade G3]|nr:conserved Plasmodium protein, unknown function [Plasmodium sp. gorilla clade G3]